MHKSMTKKILDRVRRAGLLLNAAALEGDLYGKTDQVGAVIDRARQAQTACLHDLEAMFQKPEDL